MSQAEYENLSARTPILGPDKQDTPFFAFCRLNGSVGPYEMGGETYDFWPVLVYDRAEDTGSLPTAGTVAQAVKVGAGIPHLLPDDHAIHEAMEKLGPTDAFLLHFAGRKAGKGAKTFKDWRVLRVKE